MSENYVKNYEIGNIRLDAPYAHYVHELPLLSFGDIMHTVGLSLVYNSKIEDNPYKLANGYKLNLHKRLIFENNEIYYEDASGKTIKLNAADNSSTVFALDDDSQRVVRLIDGVYIVENSDYSTESYNSNGQITSVTDKYGVTYLSYVYTVGLLTSINFRGDAYGNNKFIKFTYSGSKLSTIDYSSGNSSFVTTLTYNTNGIKVGHYSGVDYHISLQYNTYTVYSADKDAAYSNDYSHQLTCTKNDNTISIESKIGSKVVDSSVYTFVNSIGNDKYDIVDCTNRHGAITRTQYEDDKAAYSYEISESGNIVPCGTVSVYKDSEVIGTQTYNSGIKMNNVYDNIWAIETELTQSSNDKYCFTISGWLRTVSERECSLTIIDGASNQTIQTVKNLIPNVWKYFSINFYTNYPQSIAVNPQFNYSTVNTRDFIITTQEGAENNLQNANHFTQIDEVLIDESNQNPTFYLALPFPFYNGNTIINHRITSKDILRYKINQQYGNYKNEIYYDGCKGIITNAGTFSIAYNDSNGTLIKVPIESLAVGVFIHKNGNKHIHKTNLYALNSNSYYLKDSKYTNGKYYAQTLYDDKLNPQAVVENGRKTTAYFRNNNGLIIRQELHDMSSGTEIEIQYSYDDKCTKLLSTTDEFGVVTTYTTDDIWGIITGTAFADGTSTTDEFDKGACALVSKTFAKDFSRLVHTFGYSGGNLSSISVNSINYGFNYNNGDLSGVVKSGNNIESYALSDNDKTLTTQYHHIQYNGQGNTEIQRTDIYGRLTEVDGKITNTYGIDPRYESDSYVFTNRNNGSARLATSTDLVINKTTKYAYANDRLSKIGTFDSANAKLSEASFTYDSIGRVTSYEFSLGAKSVKENAEYDTATTAPTPDDRISNQTFIVNGNNVLSSTNSYDTHRRLVNKETLISSNSLIKEIGYDKTRINSVYYSVNNVYKHKYILSYDSHSRIINEQDNVSDGYTSSCEYDFLGRLTRENNQALDKTIVYSYNGIGGISRAAEYAYTTGEISGTPLSEEVYTYSPHYSDQIKAINDKTIYFDSRGFYGGFKDNVNNVTANYVWKEKNIKFIQYEQATTFQAIDFEHDAYGKRTKKIYTYYHSKYEQGLEDVFTHNYDYDTNGRLIRETISTVYNQQSPINDELLYLYDGNDVVGMIHTNNDVSNTYTFDKNYKGDVIGIYDSTGTSIVKYAYDAWGKCTILSGSNTIIANINPFRYRSYYFDLESGLYYLNARYYDPSWRIFISPDSPEYLDPETPSGLNLNAYCNNDPVNYADPSGNSPILTIVLIGTLVGFGTGFGINTGKQLISNDMDFSKVDWGAAVNVGIVGAGLGFSLAMGVAYLGPAIAGTSLAGGLSVSEALGISTSISFLSGALGYASEEWINERSPSFEKAIVHGVFVALEGIVKFGVGGMTGSIGNIGTKGKFLTSIEWWGKLALGLEFSQPIKILIDYLRNSIWYK